MPMLATGVLEHGIEARPAVTALGTRYAGVGMSLDHLPATALRNLPKLADLVLDCLRVCAHADVKSSAL
jgi:hypothetical protein